MTLLQCLGSIFIFLFKPIDIQIHIFVCIWTAFRFTLQNVLQFLIEEGKISLHRIFQASFLSLQITTKLLLSNLPIPAEHCTFTLTNPSESIKLLGRILQITFLLLGSPHLISYISCVFGVCHLVIHGMQGADAMRLAFAVQIHSGSFFTN